MIMVKFEDILDKLRKKRLFIFDFDETIVNLNVNWKALKEELRLLVLERFGLDMTFSPILEKLEYLKTKITEQDFQPILEHLKQGEISALKENSTKQTVGFTLLENIYKSIVQTRDDRYIALLSNNYTDTITLGAKQYGIDLFISCFVGRDMVKNIKPDVEGIKFIHEQFPSVNKSEIVYFGDNVKYDKLLAEIYGIDFFLIAHPE